jgi:hypothetical protein
VLRFSNVVNYPNLYDRRARKFVQGEKTVNDSSKEAAEFGLFLDQELFTLRPQRLRGAISEPCIPTVHYSITQFLYLSIYIEQHGKMYLPINCFHRGSLASYGALWEEPGVLRRDGSENAISSLYLCN